MQRTIPFPCSGALKAMLVSASALALVASLSACPKKADDATKSDPAAASSGTGPVARINGDEIERGDFDKQMERTRARFQRAGRQIAPALETRLKENLIRKLVEEQLISQKAKAEGVSVSDEELGAKVTEHKTRFGSDKAFQSFLERTGQTEADVKADLQKNLLRDKLFVKLLANSEPTEVDAKKYYDDNLDKYKQKEQIKASHILFKVDKTTTEKQKKEILAEAKKVMADTKKAGANFEEIAKKYSDGPTKDRGGDLGTFSRGRMVKPFEDVAFAAKAGDIVGPVETQFGFHVIKVYEKTPESQRSFDDVKESILVSMKARQKSKATRELLDTLRTGAKIEVLEPGVSLDPKKAPIALDGKALPSLKPAAASTGGEKAEGDDDTKDDANP